MVFTASFFFYERPAIAPGSIGPTGPHFGVGESFMFFNRSLSCYQKSETGNLTGVFYINKLLSTTSPASTFDPLIQLV